MAGRLTREKLQVDVVINGNEAQAELFKLEKRQRELKNTNKELYAERAKLIAQGKKSTAEYKNLNAEIKKNNAELKDNKSKMADLQRQVGITGLTLRQLRQKASQLRLALNNMIPGSGKYKKLQNELKAVNAQISKLNINSRASQGSLSKLADGFNKYAALGASALAVLTGWVLTAQKMIDYNGKLADSQSDVMKTTGMTKQEVDELTKSFGLLQTRTSRINLLKIAEEGGRIGIVKDEIQAFVGVMNKAAVALGDSFPGGVEEVASKLGKLKFLFQETKDLNVDLAFNAIGSSINELGANGNATETNIAEFTARIGALPEALKPSIGDTLALGAAFEESGVQAEVSARAYGIFLQQATTNTDKFAKVMGISEKQVKDLINSNPLEFFLQFSKGLQGMDATQIGDTLKYLGVNATGATKAIGAAANNQERFRELMKLSNDALVDGTSLTNEYDIKNNNLAATLEKVQKRIVGAFSSESVVKGLNNFVEWFAKFIGASEDADGKVTRFRNRLVALLKTVLILTASIISYRAAVQLAALWTGTLDQTTKLYIITQKIQTAATNAQTLASSLLKGAFYLLTGQLGKARAAMVAFNTVTKLSPIGLVVGLITAAAGAYLLFSENSKKAVTSQSLFNDAMKEAQSNTAETIKSKQLLLDVARDETLSLKQRQEAVDELNRTVPEYNNQLTIETANTLEAKAALDKHIEALKQSAIAYVLQERIKKKAVELADLESSSLEDNIKWYEQLWNGIKSGGQAINTTAKNYETATKNKQENIDKTKEEIELLEDLYKKQLKANPNNTTSTNPETDEPVNPFNVPTTSSGSGSKPKLPKGNAGELLRIQQQAENAKIALIQDAFKREMAQEDANHKFKLQKLKQQLVAEAELKKIDKQIDVARAKGTKEGDNEAAVLEQVKTEWIKKNEALNSQIETENKLHEIRKGTIISKGMQQSIKDRQKAFEEQEKLLETAHNNELATLGDNEKAREKLQEKFDEEKLNRQKAHLEKLKKEFTDILGSSEFQGFDLNLLSDEEVAEIKQNLADLGLSIAQINALLAQMQGKSPEGIDLGAGGQLDVFGFTAQQWADSFANMDTMAEKIGVGSMMVQGFMNAWAKYHEFVSAKENRELNKFEQKISKQKTRQKSLYDSGMINKRQYEAAVAALDAEADRKKADLEYKQAKRAWTMQLTQAIGSTAMAVINGLNTQPFFPLGIAMGALAAIMGGIQIATIAKNKPVRGYEKGLYPITREQDGKQFNAEYGGTSRSGLVDKPTFFLAGEAGKNSPELIINGEDLKQFHPDLRNSLYREIGRVKGYEQGFYQSQTPQPEFTGQPSGSDPMLVAVIAKNNELLEKLVENPIMAVMSEEYKNIIRLQTALKKAEKLKDKSRR